MVGGCWKFGALMFNIHKLSACIDLGFVVFTYGTFELIAGESWLLTSIDQHKPMKE